MEETTVIEKQLLLLSDEQSFMVNAIIKNLKEAGYSVERQEPGVTKISRMEQKPNIFLCYIEGFSEEMRETLVYLKDYIDEMASGILLYIIGSPEELDAAHRVMPVSFISQEFERPLNVKNLAAEIDKDVEKGGLLTVKPSILVVDDDGTMLRALKVWLSEKYQVYMANSGTNAIALLAKKKVDLILLDYEMPVLSGPKVLEMIRSEPEFSDTPVMFLTGKDDKESVLGVLALKPVKYLLKTQSPDSILASIDEFFEAKKAERI